ncbi:MAG: hypothetical protein HRT98_00080 [Mycoplasmatales bacterium]|nr:hypothetical protein [Mycoplasmatales bacterium]
MSAKRRILYFGGCFAAAGAISASTVLILASKGYIDIQPNHKNNNVGTKSRIVSDSSNTSTVEIEKLKKAIAEKERMIKEKQRAIESKEKTIKEKQRAIEGNEKTIKEKNQLIDDRNHLIEEKARMIEEKAKLIEDKERMITKKNKLIKEKEDAIKAKDDVIRAKEDAIKAKDDVIKAKDDTINEKNQAINSKNETIKALTPRIQFDKTPKRMNLRGVDWTGAFVYKDGLDNSFQYAITKSGIFSYDTKRPDEFKKMNDWDGIGDPTDGFMFQADINLERVRFVGTKNGLWVQNTDGAPIEQIAKGDFSNTNMLATDGMSKPDIFIYDRSGSLKQIVQDSVTKKWTIDSTPKIKDLPKNPKGIKTIRDTESNKSVMYVYGDEGITAISSDTQITSKKITSKPVKNINILTDTADIENADPDAPIFTLGIIFKDSVSLMKAIPNETGDWTKSIKPIKEIPVQDDLTDAKLMFIKDEGKMVPALITKAGLKIFVGTRFFDLMKADGTKETEDFTKSLVFDASSHTAIANTKGLRTIKIIHPKVKAFTSSTANIYQK